nr:hypothetical protein Iba_chr10bCG10930 [Ipomoea batatas]
MKCCKVIPVLKNLEVVVLYVEDQHFQNVHVDELNRAESKNLKQQYYAQQEVHKPQASSELGVQYNN